MVTERNDGKEKNELVRENDVVGECSGAGNPSSEPAAGPSIFAVAPRDKVMKQ